MFKRVVKLNHVVQYICRLENTLATREHIRD